MTVKQQLMFIPVWNDIDTPPQIESFEGISSMAFIEECSENTSAPRGRLFCVI